MWALNKLAETFDSKKTFYFALLIFVFYQVLDIISSHLCMKLVPDVLESNEFMRDPTTYQFLLGRALVLKMYLAMTWLAPISFIARKWFKSWGIAALPWLWEVYNLHDVVVQNFFFIFDHWLRLKGI